MNEILAIIALVYDTERLDERVHRDWDQMDDAEIAISHLSEFLFDPFHVVSDIYSSFDRILQLGVKLLYMDTKDITVLNQERRKRNTEEEKRKRELFEFD